MISLCPACGGEHDACIVCAGPSGIRGNQVSAGLFTATPWEAPDGTRWLWFPQFKEWTGWQPDEDGQWTISAEEFERMYPEGPCPPQ